MQSRLATFIEEKSARVEREQLVDDWGKGTLVPGTGPQMEELAEKAVTLKGKKGEALFTDLEILGFWDSIFTKYVAEKNWADAKRMVAKLRASKTPYAVMDDMNDAAIMETLEAKTGGKKKKHVLSYEDRAWLFYQWKEHARFHPSAVLRLAKVPTDRMRDLTGQITSGEGFQRISEEVSAQMIHWYYAQKRITNLAHYAALQSPYVLVTLPAAERLMICVKYIHAHMQMKTIHKARGHMAWATELAEAHLSKLSDADQKLANVVIRLSKTQLEQYDAEQQAQKSTAKKTSEAAAAKKALAAKANREAEAKKQAEVERKRREKAEAAAKRAAAKRAKQEETERQRLEQEEALRRAAEKKAAEQAAKKAATKAPDVTIEDASTSSEDESRSSQDPAPRRSKLERVDSVRGVKVGPNTRALIRQASRLDVAAAMAGGGTFDPAAFARKMVQQHGGAVGKTALKAAEKATKLASKLPGKGSSKAKAHAREEGERFATVGRNGKALDFGGFMAMAQKGLDVEVHAATLKEIFVRLKGAAPHSKEAWSEGDFHFEDVKSRRNKKGCVTFCVRVNEQHRVFFEVHKKDRQVKVLQVGGHNLGKGKY